VEELSGSVLVEDGPDGGPPVVTRTDASGSPKKAPSPALNALLGIPELPTSTPGPSLAPTPAKLPWEQDQPPNPMSLAEGVEPFPGPAPDFPAPPEGPAAHPPDATSGDGLAPAPDAPSATPAGPRPSEAHRDDVEVTALPRGRFVVLIETAKDTLAALQARIRDFRWRPDPGGRPIWFWPAIVIPALALGAGLVSLVRSLAGSGPTADETPASSSPAGSSPSAPASFTPLPLAQASVALPQRPPAAPRPPVLRPCALAGPSTAVAPSAIVAAGVEARPFGEDVAIGFARDDHEAVGMRMSPGSLAPAATVVSHSKDPIRRVRPVATTKGTMVLAVDADRKGDRLSARRTLPIDPPLQAGASGQSLVWSRHGGPAAGMLWSLEGDGDIDALRGASEGAPGDTTTVIAFRRASVLWLGTASGFKALTAKGELAHVDGLGTAIGSPAVALNDGEAIAAWADRASTGDPWSLRWVAFKAGEAPGAPKVFAPPPGGQGGNVMAPGLAAVPGGRFLLVWTEGPATLHHVRALTLSSEGAPIGPPLEISPDGANAGQGQAAVVAGGAGVVAFLESEDGGFRVAAVPITCGD